VRCTDEQNCAAGHCLDIGVSFDICTTECANDKECEPYTKPPHFFRCLEATADGGKRCINTTSLTGFKCSSAADCPADTPLCTSFSPAGTTQPNDECRPLCHADGSCDSRAGVPHVCLDDIAMRMRGVPGGCYPGTFGMPCEHSSECLRPAICHEITPDGFEFLPAAKICTQACESDEDCRPDPDYPKNPDRPFIGYCGPDKFCRVPLHGGTPCAEGKQCYSGTCNRDPLDRTGPLGICGADP
jgi:hypothetical protein